MEPIYNLTLEVYTYASSPVYVCAICITAVANKACWDSEWIYFFKKLMYNIYDELI